MKSKLLYLIFIYLINFISSEIIPCALRKYDEGFVCVCNSTYCDKIDIELPKDNNVLVVSSSAAGLRFKVTYLDYHSKQNIINNEPGPIDLTKIKKASLGMNLQTLENVAKGLDKLVFNFLSEPYRLEGRSIIFIDVDRKYQEIIGFGGAYTGAVTYLCDKMPTSLRNFLYRTYYTRTEGIGYSMMRIPIGGSDFDTEQWAYNEYPLDDIHLSNFTKLDEKDLSRSRQLNDLKALTNNHDIKILALVWSPPRWMKTIYRWHGRTYLKPQYYQTFADYHIKYLELMSTQNISFWSISAGNEPFFGNTGRVEFMNLAWTPENLAKYMVENFAPTIRNSKFKNLKLLIGEDLRIYTPVAFKMMLDANNKSLDEIDGFSVTWYADKMAPTTNLDQTVKLFPNKFILNTESTEPKFSSVGRFPILGNWFRGEDFALGIIESFTHHVRSWIDWNLIIDTKGLPRVNSNFSYDASIILNATDYSEFYKQPMYYAFGHFSKFVTPGSVRIDSAYSGPKILESIAFLRPDNYIVVILVNIVERPLVITIQHTKKTRFRLNIPSRSIHTILYKNNKNFKIL